MNTIKQHTCLFLLALASLSSLPGCSADDLPGSSPEGVNSAPASSFQIHVTDGGYASADAKPGTRAEENGYKTVFTADDKIGLFAVKGNQIVNEVNNLCLTASNEKGSIVWKDKEGKAPIMISGATYYAYYPYRPSLTGDLASGATDAAGFFTNVISSWSIATDQGTYANYTAQDLMIAQGTVNGKELSFSMQHQMALVVIDLPRTKYTFTNTPTIPEYIIDAPDLHFTDFFPCRMSDGKYRYLVKPNASKELSGSYTKSDATKATWKFDATITLGNYKVFKVDQATVTKISHTLTVGDFYMKDGSLESKDVAILTKEQQAACIGIVYCTDIDRIGDEAKKVLKDKGVATPHGLVMALTNASAACQWGNNGTDENSGGDVGTPFQDNTTTLQNQYNNVDGYGETHWILKNYRDNGITLQDTYTAFYHASRYGTVDSGTAQYAAPNTTTGWFIPSMGQWWDILSYLGGIDLRGYRTDQRDYISISGAAQTAVNNMNKYLGKISGANMFSTDTYFWSSSEYRYDYACYVYFGRYGSLGLHYDLKYDSDVKVRCVFAF